MKTHILLFLFFVSSFSLFSHSVEYSILSEQTIKIEMRMGAGELMTGADVLVFPPQQTEYEYKLKTDEVGCFLITPDRAGTWILQVRGDDGHGLRINLPVGDSMLVSGNRGSALSLLQKLIMVLSVSWGAIGTALYFKSRKRD